MNHKLWHDFGMTWTAIKPLQTLLWHDVTACTPLEGTPPGESPMSSVQGPKSPERFRSLMVLKMRFTL